MLRGFITRVRTLSSLQQGVRTAVPRKTCQRSFASSTMSAASEASSLADGACEPCRKGVPTLSKEESERLLHALSQGEGGWSMKPFTGSGTLPVLQKTFLFKNFRHALAFTNSVGQIAEAQKHHPELVLGWGHVDVAWWSHAIGGLHKNDFVCAAKTDEAAKEAEGRKIV